MSGENGRLLVMFGGGEALRQVASQAPGWQVVDGRGELTDDQLARAEVILGGWSAKWAQALLAPGARLKWVQTGSTGVDYLPLEQLRANGVVVTSARGVHGEAVAETAFGLMLALARGFTYAAKGAEKRQWANTSKGLENLSELRGKTAGLLGTGAISRCLAGMCAAFGMRVLGTSRSGRPVQGFHLVVPTAKAEQMLAESDFVVNILPGTPETAGFVNAERLAQMKQGAYYVSVGRGKTTNTAALVAALEGGRLAGAGLDVTDPEPLPADSPLWGMENVLILPHLGGWAKENEARSEALFMENLAAYLQTGRPVRNLVDYDGGY